MNIRIFPNPATSELNIFIDQKNDGKVKIDLLDITGKRIKNIASTQLGVGLNQIQSNVFGIQPGLYLLKFEIEDRSMIEKLIIH